MVEERGTSVSRPDVADLVARARAGEARAVARLVSLVEGGSPQLREVMAALAPYAGHAHVVGLTGSPGVGSVGLPFLTTDPAWVGLTLYVQAGFIDAGASFGVSLTNGLMISLG